MFQFIQLQYMMHKLTSEQVMAFVPRWITSEEAAEIVALHS